MTFKDLLEDEREEGREEGRKEEKHKIAKALLVMGKLSLGEISIATGLSEEEIKIL